MDVTAQIEGEHSATTQVDEPTAEHRTAPVHAGPCSADTSHAPDIEPTRTGSTDDPRTARLPIFEALLSQWFNPRADADIDTTPASDDDPSRPSPDTDPGRPHGNESTVDRNGGTRSLRAAVDELFHAHAHDLAHRTIEPSELAAMNLATLEDILSATQRAGAAVLPARPRRTYAFETRPTTPPGLDDPAQALAWLDEHKPTIVEAIQRASDLGYWQLAYLLARDVQPLFIVHKDYDQNLVVSQLGLVAARKSNDTTGQVDMQARQFGNLLGRGDLVQADRLAHHLLAWTTARGDRADVARALNCVGRIHHERQDLDGAEDAYRQAVDISGELDDDYSQALTRITLGAFLTDNGRADKAQAVLTEALAQFDRLPERDLYNTARAAIELARAYRSLGELDQAQHLLATAEPASQTYGSATVLSSLRYELAHVHAALNESQLPNNPVSQPHRS